MDTAFFRTLRSLDDDRARRSVGGVIIAAAVLLAWAAWFFLAHLERYEVTDTARVEIDRATHPIQSEIPGRVRVNRIVMGQMVTAGDVLLELDTNPEQLLVREEHARVDAISPQVQALREQLLAIDRTQAREREATRLALDEARARFREADVMAKLADVEAERLGRLFARGLTPERDRVQARAEADSRRAAAESAALVVRRLESEQRTRESERDATRDRLQGEISRLEGEKTTGSATLRRLEYEAERRLVRAPVSGRIVEGQVLRPGAYVRDGEVLGAIVPSGTLRIVAEFAPEAALGRIRAGQRARLRLEGFPWAQYGSVPATVSAVAGEIRGGRVRVELNIGADRSRVPLQHGLPGSVEVEVERVTPALLVFRAAGQLISSPVSPSAARQP
jgi:multidrug resistance efflux pump